MRFRLRTLLIVLAVLPPLLWLGWGRYRAWKAEQDRRAAYRDPAIFGLGPPTAWGGMLLPNEAYGFAAPLDGTSPTIVVGAEDRPRWGWRGPNKLQSASLGSIK
jgi:hypothetical protein